MHSVANRFFSPARRRRVTLALASLLGLAIAVAFLPQFALAQDVPPGGPSAEPAPRILNVPEGEELDAALTADGKSDLNLFSLLLSGGIFMIPIGFLSVLVATFSVERAISLRRGRILPKGLVDGLSNLGSRGGFDPRQAYQLCKDYPSASANVIRAMLLKIGRPHSEVEQAVRESSNREANRLYANVRWLTFSAAVAPLLGLLGTVWGMILAFHDTTQLPVGVDKGTYLAEGIYIALVTTLAGLVVAIVGASAAHLFEARIQTLFLEVEELLFHLLPQVERYEGRVRFTKSDEPSEPERTEYAASPPAPPVGSPV
jgi:biopolymer transport protein ExbB